MDKRAWPVGIRPSGKGLQIRIWHKGRLFYQETISGDPWSARHIATAKRRRATLQRRIALGLPIEGSGKGQVVTVAELCQELLNLLDAKDSTHIGYERIFNRYWLPSIGGWPAAEVTQSKIKELLNRMQRADKDTFEAISAKTKRNILGPLREAFKHGGISPNPCDGIKIRRAQKAPVERYKPEERAALLNAMPDAESRLYFALLFGTGMRPCGEPLALQWPDWDGENLNINKQMTRRQLEPTTKTSKVRKVYVPKWVRQLLSQYPTRFEGNYIFQNSFGRPHLDADKFNEAWRSAHKKCRLPYRDAYKCRHTRAAELLSQGIEPADAAKQLGHSPEMFLRIYSEFIEEFSKHKDKSRFEGVPVELEQTLAN